MSDLRFQQPDCDATLRDWQHVHNVIIPTHVLSLEEVRERSERNHHRARELGVRVIEAVVLSSNEDGLRFAQRHGFIETERYLLPGDTILWIDLRLS